MGYSPRTKSKVDASEIFTSKNFLPYLKKWTDLYHRDLFKLLSNRFDRFDVNAKIKERIKKISVIDIVFAC